MELINYSLPDLTRGQIIEIINLTSSTFPDNAYKSSKEKKVAEFCARHSEKICHCLHQDKELIGFPESFPITIKIVNKELEVMGIGDVCVYPEFRGKGLGASIVKSAFARIDANQYPCLLYTSPSPRD